ncbi:MAG: L,D-transpeptidase family protein [Verrucomicrobiota bacterium]
MQRSTLLRLTFPFLLSLAVLGSSCTVEEQTALFSSGARTGETKKKIETTEGETKSFAERMAEARAAREEARAEAEKKREAEAAVREKAEAKAKREAEAAKRKEDEAAEKLRIAREKKEAEEAAARLAEKKRLEAEREQARIAAREKAEADRAERDRLAAEARAQRERQRAASGGSSGGGLFASLFSGGSSSTRQYQSEGHHVYINHRLLAALGPENSRIEVDLSDQRARIYKGDDLVIETQISTGKSGHTTPTGSFRISEKKVDKRSTIYGRWVNSSGSTVASSGNSRSRPRGGSQFIGAEMPYWMRINGGIGMHVGFVPDYPASHGCIRVPSAVQPLIFSKVGVGTKVTVRY